MPLMRSPDGSETIEVAPEEVGHYRSLGATVVVPMAPSAREVPREAFSRYDIAREQFGQGTPDEPGGMGVPFYADPVDMFGAGASVPARAGAGMLARGITGAAGSAANMAGRAVGGAAGSPLAQGAGAALFEAGLEFLHPAIRIPLRGGMAMAKAMGGQRAPAEVASEVGASATDPRMLAKALWSDQKAARKLLEQATSGPAGASLPKGKIAVRGYERSIPKPKPEAPKLHPAVAKRVAAGKPLIRLKPNLPEPVKKRIAAAGDKKLLHEVQYFSKSKGKYIDIDTMNQKHIESAYRTTAATNPKPGSVGRRVLDALLNESKHRLQTTGIHIGQ